jgi:hypothetical protein
VRWSVPQPFLAAAGDVMVSSERTTRSCPAARVLAGVALVGRYGELSPFAGIEGGCDKGLLYPQRAFVGEGGVRYAPFR